MGYRNYSEFLFNKCMSTVRFLMLLFFIYIFVVVVFKYREFGRKKGRREDAENWRRNGKGKRRKGNAEKRRGENAKRQRSRRNSLKRI